MDTKKLLKERIDNFINLYSDEHYKSQYVKEMNKEDVKDIYNKYIAPILDFDDSKKTVLFNKLEKASKNTYRESNENSRSWYRICKELALILYVDSLEEIDINNSVDALVRLKLWEYTPLNTLSEYKDYASIIWSTINKDRVNFRDKYFIK